MKHSPIRFKSGFSALSLLLTVSSVSAENVNTTFQTGEININRTFQCGDSNVNATYQEGRININHTIQACGRNQNITGQSGNRNLNRTNQDVGFQKTGAGTSRPLITSSNRKEKKRGRGTRPGNN